jgi:hypothetical protein
MLPQAPPAAACARARPSGCRAARGGARGCAARATPANKGRASHGANLRSLPLRTAPPGVPQPHRSRRGDRMTAAGARPWRPFRALCRPGRLYARASRKPC